MQNTDNRGPDKGNKALSWKTVSGILIGIIICTLIGFFLAKFYLSNNQTTFIKHEIILKNADGKKVNIVIDSLSVYKLESLINNVKERNDGRFDVLAWSSALVLGVLALFLGINYLVSSAQIRDLVKEEVEEELKKKHQEITESLQGYEEAVGRLKLTLQEQERGISEINKSINP